MSQTPQYALVQEKGFSVLKLFGRLEPDSAAAFELEVATVLESEPKALAVNCERLVELPQPWVRTLMQVAKKLKDAKKDVRLYGTSSPVAAFLRQMAVDQTLRMAPNLRTALKEMGVAPPATLDVKFINPFLEAVIDVLKIQASTDSKAGQIYRKKPNDTFLGDISGVIGIVSDAFTGSVVVSFPSTTFLKLMSRMLGEEFPELTQEIADGAGELTNIIFGKAKAALNERGYGIQTAIPSIVKGKDHSVKAVDAGPVVVVPFETDIGGFFIEICIASQA